MDQLREPRSIHFAGMQIESVAYRTLRREASVDANRPLTDVAEKSDHMDLPPTRKRPRRILHVVRQYFPSVGGLEQHVHDLAQSQSRRGAIFILTLNRVFGRKGRLPAIERRGRVVVIRVPFIGFRMLFLPLFARSLLDRFDLIHVHGLDQCADLVSFFSMRGGPPFVLTTHGLFFHTERLKQAKRFYFATISRRTLSSARRVFAVSQMDRERLKSIDIESLHVRNPITPFEWQYKGGNDLIYVGRYSENKNIQNLIPFAAELRSRGWTHRLHIVGGGDEAIHARLKTLIATHRLDDVVRLHGYLNRGALTALLGECGYAISASRYEGYGMAMVEAMSAGLLPVMQPNLAFQELHSQCPCGVLVDFEKPSQAAQQFLIWEKTADLERRNDAREFALSQGWEAVADAIDDQYVQCLANRSAPSHGLAVRRIAGVVICVCNRAEAFAFLSGRLKAGEKTRVAFANTNLIVQANRRAQSLVALSGMTIFNDGLGVDLASRLLFAKRFPANLNGTDFTPAFLETCSPATRVYLYGARQKVVRKAAEVLANRYAVTVCGLADGYGSCPDVVSQINGASADVVLVALGNPAQEEWIAEHREKIAAPLIIGVGALFDFLAGAVPRAPLWVQNMHLEWAFRLLHEPRRLARRYTIDMAVFLKLVLVQKMTRRAVASPYTDSEGNERAV